MVRHRRHAGEQVLVTADKYAINGWNSNRVRDGWISHESFICSNPFSAVGKRLCMRQPWNAVELQVVVRVDEPRIHDISRQIYHMRINRRFSHDATGCKCHVPLLDAVVM